MTTPHTTRRNETEEALRKSENLLSEVVNGSPIPAFVIDREHTITHWNRACEQLTGIPAGEVIGTKRQWCALYAEQRPVMADLVVDGTPERMDEYYGDRYHESTLIEGAYSAEDFFPALAGGRWLYITAAPLRDAEGRLIGAIETLQDTTGRREAEARITHLNTVLRAIRNVNQLIVKEKDRNALIQRACELLTGTRGYHNVWITLMDGGKVVSGAQDGVGDAFEPMLEMLKRGELTQCARKSMEQEGVMITRDPSASCADCPLSGMYAGSGAMTIRLEHGGKVYGLMSTSVPSGFIEDEEEQALLKEVAGDIALALHGIEVEEERKRAEQKLQRQQKEQQLILDTVPALIFYKDMENRLVRVNDAFAKAMGMAKEQLEGKSCFEVCSAQVAEGYWEDDKEVIASGEPKRGIIEPFETAEGTKWVQTDKIPFEDEEGKVTGIIGEGNWYNRLCH